MMQTERDAETLERMNRCTTTIGCPDDWTLAWMWNRDGEWGASPTWRHETDERTYSISLHEDYDAISMWVYDEVSETDDGDLAAVHHVDDAFGAEAVSVVHRFLDDPEETTRELMGDDSPEDAVDEMHRLQAEV